MSNILKPNSVSRRWRVRRNPPAPAPFNSVREPYLNQRHNARRGEYNKPKPVEKPAPFDVTAFQKQAHEGTAIVAHEFHANRSKYGTFGRSPLNRNPLTVAQRKAASEAAKQPVTP